MSLVKSIFVPTYSPRNKRMSIRGFLVLFLAMFLSTVSLSVLQDLLLPDLAPAGNPSKMGELPMILYLVLWVPFVEESCFRMWLKRGRYTFGVSIIGSTLHKTT